jgi:hypothetical protein
MISRQVQLRTAEAYLCGSNRQLTPGPHTTTAAGPLQSYSELCVRPVTATAHGGMHTVFCTFYGGMHTEEDLCSESAKHEDVHKQMGLHICVHSLLLAQLRPSSHATSCTA